MAWGFNVSIWTFGGHQGEVSVGRTEHGTLVRMRRVTPVEVEEQAFLSSGARHPRDGGLVGEI